MRTPYGAEYSLERLRASGMVFVAGKVVSVALGLLIFYLVATRMPVAAYALYVWLLAFGQLLLQFSYVGVNSVAWHYVPYVQSQCGRELRQRFLVTLVVVRLTVILVCIGTVATLATGIVGVFGDQHWVEPLRWYALVLVIEHSLDFLRRCIFGPLMRQVALQSNMIAQAVGILVALGVGLTIGDGDPTIYWVLGAHACGSGIALALAAAQFWYMTRSRTEPGGRGSLPTWREMIRFGLENFSHQVLSLSSGAQIMTLLGRPLLGVAELATFGFIQNLYARIQRIVPGRFFMGLIRPNVIVRYRADSSFERLNRRIVLILKLSLCVWAALAIFLIVTGEPIVALLSSDKYRDGYGLLIGFAGVLAIQDLKRAVVLVTNTLGISRLLRRAGFAYLIGVPIAIGLVAAGAGFYGLLIGMICADLGFVVSLVLRLRASGFRLDFDLAGQMRILAAAAVATAAGAGAMLALPDGLGFTFLSGALALSGYAVALCPLRPFRADERETIERLLNRKLAWL